MRQQDLTYLTTSSPSSDEVADTLKELSAEGWQDELVDDFNARAADSSFTVGDTARAMEADSFVRDLVTAEQMCRRSLADTRLQQALQTDLLTSERGPLDKQWYQVGTKVTAPAEEEIAVDV